MKIALITENSQASKNELVYKGIQDRSWNGYGFKLENVKKSKPIEAKGKLGFWNYDMYEK